MSNPLNIGKCGGCETPIFKKVGLKTVPNELYSEIVIVTQDGHIARHGVCSSCASTITDKKAQKIFERIQDTWEEEMQTTASQRTIQRMRKLKVDAVGHSQESAVQDHKMKKEKRMEVERKRTK